MSKKEQMRSVEELYSVELEGGKMTFQETKLLALDRKEKRKLERWLKDHGGKYMEENAFSNDVDEKFELFVGKDGKPQASYKSKSAGCKVRQYKTKHGIAKTYNSPGVEVHMFHNEHRQEVRQYTTYWVSRGRGFELVKAKRTSHDGENPDFDLFENLRRDTETSGVTQAEVRVVTYVSDVLKDTSCYRVDVGRREAA